MFRRTNQLAEDIGVSFVLKESPMLLHELQQFMVYHFSFGDFIFRMPDGTEVGRASDMKSLEEMLSVVPEESIRYHADRNHFSSWLKARTEFWLADKIRPRKVTDFPTVEGLRKDLVKSLHHYRNLCQRGIVANFQKRLLVLKQVLPVSAAVHSAEKHADSVLLICSLTTTVCGIGLRM